MKTNRTYIFTALLSIFLIATSAGILSDNGRAGVSGSPTENNCTQCHSSFALNAAGGSMTITTTIPPTGYVPGTTYGVSVTVSRPSMAVFGLGVECLTTGNVNAGTFVITKPTETHILTGGNARKNVTHQLNGGVASGSKTFDFNWTAPTAGKGTVTFYGASVAGNKNGSDNGDYVYTTTLAVNEAVTNAIAPTFAEENLSIYPNPATDWINVKAVKADVKEIRIIDINGKTVANEKASETTTLFIKNLPTGLYYVQALDKANDVVSVQQFIKQ